MEQAQSRAYPHGEREIFDALSAAGASTGGTRLGRTSRMISETGIHGAYLFV